MHDGHFFDEIKMRKSKTTLIEIGEPELAKQNMIY